MAEPKTATIAENYKYIYVGKDLAEYAAQMRHYAQHLEFIASHKEISVELDAPWAYYTGPVDVMKNIFGEEEVSDALEVEENAKDW